MKFTVQTDELLDVLSKVQGLTGRKSNLAITSNVFIKTVASGIYISATDLETGFEGLYPAAVESEGEIAVNARKLFEIVRDFPIDEVNIHEVENRWILIGNRNIEYHIVGSNPSDFPDIPHIEAVEFFTMTSEALRKMIEQAVVIGASDDKRAHITGVLFEKIHDNGLKMVRMVSTDGSRLSKIDYLLENDMDPDLGTGILIPKKGLSEVGKFLDAEGAVQIGCKENHLIIKKDSETIIIRLLEGNFPEYKELITVDQGNTVNLDRLQFLAMLKRMSILYSESYKGVILHFSEDRLEISSTNPDIGDSKEDMTIVFRGEPIEAAFNPRYFIESLSVMDDDNISLNMVNGEKPCIIEGAADKRYLSVIMPMRI
jgi:DNA polymerase-3 subunit beta